MFWEPAKPRLSASALLASCAHLQHQEGEAEAGEALGPCDLFLEDVPMLPVKSSVSDKAS